MTNTTEEGLVGAGFRLTMMRERHHDLGRAEAEARIELVAAIIAWDEKLELCEQAAARGDNPRPHDLFEQAMVEATLRKYGDALAALVRGES